MKATPSCIKLRPTTATLAVIVLLMIISVSEINAQNEITGAMNGLIVDSLCGRPIKGARVTFIYTVNNVVTAKLTDVDGRFYQGLLGPGEYRIQISASGYHPVELTRFVFATQVTTLVPLPLPLDPLNPNRSRCESGGRASGALAVASLPNAVITAESLENHDDPHQCKIQPDQLLCVLDGLPAQGYIVSASLKGYKPSEKKEVIISTNKTSILTLNLTATETLTRVIQEAGHFYALIIGNNEYRHIGPLLTAVADARAVAAVLKDKYGFETQLLLNADRKQTLKALNEYRNKVQPNDSLIIYYAGHGNNDQAVDKAYWLPVDAEEDDNAEWISADDITTDLRGIPAKHILVISDSCYSGALNRSKLVGLSKSTERESFFLEMITGKSRNLMASGGDEPVADTGGNGHSVFANALLSGLNKMEIDRDVFTAEQLFVNFIRPVVRGNQTPEYSPLMRAGHDNGDFVFLRTRR